MIVGERNVNMKFWGVYMVCARKFRDSHIQSRDKWLHDTLPKTTLTPKYKVKILRGIIYFYFELITIYENFFILLFIV